MIGVDGTGSGSRHMQTENECGARNACRRKDNCGPLEWRMCVVRAYVPLAQEGRRNTHWLILNPRSIPRIADHLTMIEASLLNEAALIGAAARAAARVP